MTESSSMGAGNPDNHWHSASPDAETAASELDMRSIRIERASFERLLAQANPRANVVVLWGERGEDGFYSPRIRSVGKRRVDTFAPISRKRLLFAMGYAPKRLIAAL